MGERAERTAATRTAIVDAALEIGDPRVPLEAIAERAGVSSRTILRHFGDRQGLFVAASQAGAERVAAERFSVPPGDIDAAVANLVRHYEDGGEQVLHHLALEGSDERIDRVLADGRELHRRWVEEKLGPLLGDAGQDRTTHRRRIAQLVAACDIYTWKILRRDSGLSAAQTAEAIAELIRGITRGEER